MAVELKWCFFDTTYVGKAKMWLRGGRFFQFSKSCLQFGKRTPSQTYFGFYNLMSKAHCFSDTAIYF